MRHIKQLLVLFLVFNVFTSCEKEEVSYALQDISAPTDVSVLFDISQDEIGLVSLTPSATGASEFHVYFGDVANETPTKVNPGETITHVYPEGEYSLRVIAVGLTGLTSELVRIVTVSHEAPENLSVNIAISGTNPFEVLVTPSATNATVFDLYFGDVEDEEPTTIMASETASHEYAEVGDYTIRVVARGAGAATLEISEEVTISGASKAVTLPITFEDATVNYAVSGFGASDFGPIPAAVIDNPDKSGINTTAKVLSVNKTADAQVWAGASIPLAGPIDFTTGTTISLKVWSPRAGTPILLKIEDSSSPKDGNGNPTVFVEVQVNSTLANTWEELTFDLSSNADFSASNSYDTVIVFPDFGTEGNGELFYFDDIKLASAPVDASAIVGTWKLAPEEKALLVGSTGGDIYWFNSIEDLTKRACLFDDTYVFNSDGSFNNVLGADTWIEGWQGGSDVCGAAVAPHDGSVAATYVYNTAAGTIKLNGKGAYLGIPKAYNGGELGDPANAADEITYNVELSDNDNTMNLEIIVGGGNVWYFKLVREDSGNGGGNGGGNGTSEPTAAAPTPTNPSGNVKSVFSDAYTDPAGANYFPAWGQSTAFEMIDINGNATIKYSNMNYQGIVIGENVDASAFGFVHIDVWSADYTSLPFYMISGSGEKSVTLNLTPNQWNSINIPLSEFTNQGLNINDVKEFKFDVQPNDGGTIFIDNLYFYKTDNGNGGNGDNGGTTGTAPYSPIDFETGGHGANWSWTVFENISNPALEIVANPSVSGINTSSTVAKFTALQGGQPWAGVESKHGSDIGSFTFDETNKIVRIMVYKTVISDVGLKFSEASGEA